jgi:hypothetical protein
MPNSFVELYLNQLLTRCEHKISKVSDETPSDQVENEGSLKAKTPESYIDPIVHLKMISVGTKQCPEQWHYSLFYNMSPACR